MKPNPIKSKHHDKARNFFRVAGPVVLVIGGLFMLVGLGSFFSAFGSHGGPPKYFWCAFIGMPLLVVGITLCKLGYAGAALRYLAGESAPVAADTVNYTAEATKPGMKTVASALREGWEEGGAASSETVETRLKRLDGLRREGLVTEQEYAEQRQRILADL